MELLLRDKFRRNRELRDKLAKTQNREIMNIISKPDNNNKED